MKLFVAPALLALCACATAEDAAPADPGYFLSWMTGCWQNADGSIREVWSEDEGGYLFGYSVYLKAGKAGFFEQLRIDPGPAHVLNAYPAGEGPSPFTESQRGDQSIVFENPAHDFPQQISYSRDGDALNAHISLLDGSQRGDFNYVPCAN